jgi:hypothetical protein
MPVAVLSLWRLVCWRKKNWVMASIEAQWRVIRDVQQIVAYHGRCSADCLLVASTVLVFEVSVSEDSFQLLCGMSCHLSRIPCWMPATRHRFSVSGCLCLRRWKVTALCEAKFVSWRRDQAAVKYSIPEQSSNHSVLHHDTQFYHPSQS